MYVSFKLKLNYLPSLPGISLFTSRVIIPESTGVGNENNIR